MIVYLGMPRCASSWLYSHLSSDMESKESHYLYTNPADVNAYCSARVLDFSTNNWSMDSNVAQLIDPYVSHYVFIFRDPIELAMSYKSIIANSQPFEEFVKYQIITKLLCYGDIIERWYSLVEQDKILIYDYAEVGTSEFLKTFASSTGISTMKYNDKKINSSNYNTNEVLSSETILTLKTQVSKLEKITNKGFNFLINNLS